MLILIHKSMSFYKSLIHFYVYFNLFSTGTKLFLIPLVVISLFIQNPDLNF
jgi:hypothetical protein